MPRPPASLGDDPLGVGAVRWGSGEGPAGVPGTAGSSAPRPTAGRALCGGGLAGAGAHAHWAGAAAAGAAGSEWRLLGGAWLCSCRSCRSLRSRCRREVGCRRL